MDYYIKEEYETFLSEVTSSDFEIGQYIDISSYEDDYGNSEIEDAMEQLADMFRAYLKENMPGKFVVSTGWCVFVMTPERARKSRVSEHTIEEYLVR